MKIISVVVARSNLIKIALFIRAINAHSVILSSLSTLGSIFISYIHVHTGQHYDDKMSDSFFKLLDIPRADINMGICSGNHAAQFGRAMIEFEKVLIKRALF